MPFGIGGNKEDPPPIKILLHMMGLCLLNTKPIAEDVQFLLCSTKETEHLLNISYMPYNYTFQVSP